MIGGHFYWAFRGHPLTRVPLKNFKVPLKKAICDSERERALSRVRTFRCDSERERALPRVFAKFRRPNFDSGSRALARALARYRSRKNPFFLALARARESSRELSLALPTPWFCLSRPFLKSFNFCFRHVHMNIITHSCTLRPWVALDLPKIKGETKKPKMK